MERRDIVVRRLIVVFTIVLSVTIPYGVIAIASSASRAQKEASFDPGRVGADQSAQSGPTGTSLSSTPTASATRSPELTPSPTASTSPTPSGFDGAYVDGVTELSDTRSMVRIVVPGGVRGDYWATVAYLRSLDFSCFIPDWYTDRLYCVGPRLPRGQVVSIAVYPIEAEAGSTPVFEATFVVDPAVPATESDGGSGGGPGSTDTPTPTRTWTPTSTSTRTNTPLPSPTSTPPPSATSPPTNTPVPPTATPLPEPTNTPVPPPTNTPVPPPTATPVPPPTNTPIPPTPESSARLSLQII